MLERRAASGGENPKKIRGPQIHKHTQFDQIKSALEVFPMGYQFLKENKSSCFGKRSLVEQNDGWYFTLALGRCEGVGG